MFAAGWGTRCRFPHLSLTRLSLSCSRKGGGNKCFRTNAARRFQSDGVWQLSMSNFAQFRREQDGSASLEAIAAREVAAVQGNNQKTGARSVLISFNDSWLLGQNSVQRRLGYLDRALRCKPDDIHGPSVLRRTGVVGSDLAAADGSCLIPMA
jgi:hypothetical protein